MTTQTVHIQTYDYGASLSSATLRVVATDVLVATADSVNEVTADSGLYAAVFGELAAIAAGEYRLRAVVAGKPINRYVTLAGTDGEIVEARNERLAVLDSAIQTQLDDIETDAAASVGYLTSLTSALAALAGKFTGITLLARWLGALAGKTADTTTRAEINATTAGAGFNETTDSQEAIRDRGDAAWNTGSGGGGGGPAYSAAVVAARLPVGAAIGWPQEIACGAAYLSEMGTHVPLYVKDVDDNILAELGSKTFADADFEAILRLSPLTDANKPLSQPPATIEISSEDTPGIVFNDDTAGAEYFELQMPKAKTALGEIRTRYLCQVILRWGDGSEYEWIVNLGESKFIRGVAAAAP